MLQIQWGKGPPVKFSTLAPRECFSTDDPEQHVLMKLNGDEVDGNAVSFMDGTLRCCAGATLVWRVRATISLHWA
jgi:hypothetical protein